MKYIDKFILNPVMSIDLSVDISAELERISRRRLLTPIEDVVDVHVWHPVFLQLK
jgi:hypothetical protein